MLTITTENSTYDIFLNDDSTFHVRKIAESKSNNYGIDVGWTYNAKSLYLCIGESAIFDSVITSRVRSIRTILPETL